MELGSSVPNDCHAPLACWLAAKKASAACTAGSEASAPPATRASTATAVVSGSTSVPVGSPLKFQPPFACWAARMAAERGGRRRAAHELLGEHAVERVAERGAERGGVGAAAGVEESDEVHRAAVAGGIERRRVEAERRRGQHDGLGRGAGRGDGGTEGVEGVERRGTRGRAAEVEGAERVERLGGAPRGTGLGVLGDRERGVAGLEAREHGELEAAVGLLLGLQPRNRGVGGRLRRGVGRLPRVTRTA